MVQRDLDYRERVPPPKKPKILVMVDTQWGVSVLFSGLLKTRHSNAPSVGHTVHLGTLQFRQQQQSLKHQLIILTHIELYCAAPPQWMNFTRNTPALSIYLNHSVDE